MHDFKIENLVLDAAPLLSTAASSSTSSLRGLADIFTTTPDVVAEIRDKTSRELFNSTLQVLGLDSTSESSETGGLLVKTPSADAVAKSESCIVACDHLALQVCISL
jgi:rRNA maturation endonuclease Nob1